MRTTACALFVFLVRIPAAAVAAHPIVLDGRFDDWQGVAPLYQDAEGDAMPGGLDFLTVSVTNDSFSLLIQFDLAETLLHHDNNTLVLRIDSDNDPATGRPIGGIGAELEWWFGSPGGLFHAITSDTVHWSDLGLVIAPCYTSRRFELALDRHARLGESTPLFSGESVAFYLQDDTPGGDVAPDTGACLVYGFDDQEGCVPEPLGLEKDAPSDLRIVTYNVLWDNPWNEVERFRRILGVIEPDIVTFQEIFSHDADATAAWMADLFPVPWYAAQCGDDLVTVSRFPIVSTWYPGTEYAGAHLIALPGPSGPPLLVLNLHLPWGTDDPGRQRAIDSIMASLRDAMTPGSVPGVPEGTPIIITGDTNMLGDAQQVDTMLLGDIADNATHGPDFDPDWDGSSLEELLSLQPNRRLAYTWYNEASDECPAHIDRITYTGSVVEIANHFILHTPLLTEELLDLYGLCLDDTKIASDHVPHVADLRLTPLGTPLQDASVGRIDIHPNPAALGSWVRIGMPGATAQVRIFDLAGRCVQRIRSEPNASRIHTRISVSPGVYCVRGEPRGVDGTVLIILSR